jgi:hypothetical protein
MRTMSFPSLEFARLPRVGEELRTVATTVCPAAISCLTNSWPIPRAALTNVKSASWFKEKKDKSIPGHNVCGWHIRINWKYIDKVRRCDRRVKDIKDASFSVLCVFLRSRELQEGIQRVIYPTSL